MRSYIRNIERQRDVPTFTVRIALSDWVFFWRTGQTETGDASSPAEASSEIDLCVFSWPAWPTRSRLRFGWAIGPRSRALYTGFSWDLPVCRSLNQSISLGNSLAGKSGHISNGVHTRRSRLARQSTKFAHLNCKMNFPDRRQPKMETNTMYMMCVCCLIIWISDNGL